MVNSTDKIRCGIYTIYNSRNLYGQFDIENAHVALLSTTVEIYMVNSTVFGSGMVSISTTVEIYMVNSTYRGQAQP